MKRSDFLKKGLTLSLIAAAPVALTAVASTPKPANKYEELVELCKNGPYTYWWECSHDPKGNDHTFKPDIKTGFWDKLYMSDKGLSHMEFDGFVDDMYKRKPDLFEHIYARVMYYKNSHK